MSHANVRAFESRQKARLPMLDFMVIKLSLAWKIGVAQSYLSSIWSSAVLRSENMKLVDKSVAAYSRN